MHGLGTWLQSNGHTVSILASHTEAESYEIDGLAYRTVRARDLSRRYHELKPPVTMIPAMARALREIRPDIVHAFSYHDAWAARLARVPCVIWYGGIIVPSSWVKGRAHLQRRMFERISKGAMVACPSIACANAMRQDYGLECEVIPNGLDTAAFAPTEASVPGRILCAATPNDSRKRPEFLVEAFARVADAVPEAHLVFAGAASDTTRRNLTSMLPPAAQPRLSFLGDVDRAEMSREFARASVSALTSVNEAFGLVLIESFASGTPAVGTRSGALPELIDESVGGLFDTDDVVGCAEQIERLLREGGPDQRARCIAHAKRWDWDEIGPQVVELYNRRLLKGSNKK
jgi:glycosyltransferase involved in cell wall biosynthesis